MEGDWLRLELPVVAPAKPVWPDRAALVELAGIADLGCEPERLRGFAAKYGPLGCPHARRSGSGIFGSTSPTYECLACWRELAEQYVELLRLAARAGRDATAARDLQQALVRLVTQHAIQPLPLLNPPRVVWSTPAGLPGYLTIAMLGLWAAADGRGLPELCAGCGAIFEGLDVYERDGDKVRRRLRRDRLHYCATCRESGQGARDAARRWRARRLEGNSHAE